jgi:hypothetical protein
MLSVTQDCVVSSVVNNEWIGIDVEKAVVASFKVPSRRFLGGTEEDNKK